MKTRLSETVKGRTPVAIWRPVSRAITPSLAASIQRLVECQGDAQCLQVLHEALGAYFDNAMLRLLTVDVTGQTLQLLAKRGDVHFSDELDLLIWRSLCNFEMASHTVNDSRHWIIPIHRSGMAIGVIHLASERVELLSQQAQQMLSIFASVLALKLSSISNSALHVTSVDDLPRCQVRYHAYDGSLFINDSYLIKGIAGKVLWRLLNEYLSHGRCEFSNRELRLDAALGLPEITDNLSVRLNLLQKRLAEMYPALALIRTGRGRFRLRVNAAVSLDTIN